MSFHPTPTSPGRLSRRSLLLAALPLAGACSTDITSIRRAAAGDATPAGDAVASGRIAFVVDGQPLAYGALNRPHLQVFHRGRGQLMSSPETGQDGRFRWRLPAGDYGVAVIFGGMAPHLQPHRLPGGATVHVNGIVDPGLEFTLQAGRDHDLGTLVVEVASRLPPGVLFGSERVFDRLLAIRVEPDAGADVAVAPALRRITRQRPAAATAAAR